MSIAWLLALIARLQRARICSRIILRKPVIAIFSAAIFAKRFAVDILVICNEYELVTFYMGCILASRDSIQYSIPNGSPSIYQYLCPNARQWIH